MWKRNDLPLFMEIATPPLHKVWLYIISWSVREYHTNRDVIIVGEGPLRGAYSFRTRRDPDLAALARIWDLCMCDLVGWTAPQRYPADHQAIESRILKSRLQFEVDIRTPCKKLYIIAFTTSRLCWRVACPREQVSRDCILVIVECILFTNSIGCIRISSNRKFTT